MKKNRKIRILDLCLSYEEDRLPSTNLHIVTQFHSTITLHCDEWTFHVRLYIIVPCMTVAPRINFLCSTHGVWMDCCRIEWTVGPTSSSHDIWTELCRVHWCRCAEQWRRSSTTQRVSGIHWRPFSAPYTTLSAAGPFSDHQLPSCYSGIGCVQFVSFHWVIVCKTFRPMLSDRCPVCLSCRFCLWRWCTMDCGQTVGWIKMKLGTHSSPPKKK